MMLKQYRNCNVDDVETVQSFERCQSSMNIVVQTVSKQRMNCSADDTKVVVVETISKQCQCCGTDDAKVVESSGQYQHSTNVVVRAMPKE